ncbi:hypothetical protein SEVIR_3G152050v4 [Setaria viridis]
MGRGRRWRPRRWGAARGQGGGKAGRRALPCRAPNPPLHQPPMPCSTAPVPTPAPTFQRTRGRVGVEPEPHRRLVAKANALSQAVPSPFLFRVALVPAPEGAACTGEGAHGTAGRAC